MADSGISAEEFTRLQTQLIELRTQNYEIAEKYKKTSDENNVLQKRIDIKDKELQKASKLMKIPGFGALTKNKNKKSYEEIYEENERLAHQMQRHEEDFNLQNKTLLEEVSRLSTENEKLESQLEDLKDGRSRANDESDEIRRVKAENTVLHKKLQKLEAPRKSPDNSVDDIDSMNLTEHEKSVEEREDGDSNTLNGNIRELVKSSLLEIRETEKENTDEEHDPDSLRNERDRVIEELVSNIKTLFGKASNSSSDSGSLEELKVKLETEQAENELLREQLKEERGASQKEVTSLKAEIEKLTEKAKRKQESYLQLQEEKEAMHKETRQIEEKFIISKEENTKSKERVAELKENLELTRTEKENMEKELDEVKQVVKLCSPEKIAELENAMNGKNEELLSLKSTLEESSSSNQTLMSEIQKISLEKNKSEEEAQQNSQLAASRKSLLDKLSVERQHELTSHKEELAEVRNQLEGERQKLEACLSDLEKSKREITHTNDRHAQLLQNFNSMEKKAGWLERTLKETETQIETERQENILLSQQKEKETKESIESIREEQLLEIEKLNEEKAVVEQERDEHISVIEKLNQTAKDKEIEFRINNKKGDQLLKDLKRQLKVERKRADQVQQRLQDFLTESKCKQTFDEIFKPELSMYKGHRRQDSGSHLSTISSNSGMDLSTDHENTKSSTPLSGTPVSGGSDSFKLNDETIELISKVADLQLEKNILEERVRHLEENGSVMVDDLMRKTGIIQSYIRDTKTDHHSENVRKRNMTLKEKMRDSLNLVKHGKTEDMLKEMNAKMQRLLEETLEKNIQLEKDVDLLTKELEKLTKKT